MEGAHKTAALDWSQCPAMESVPRSGGGAWVFRGTRIPVSTVFEGLQDMGIDALVEEFDVTREQVQAVLRFVAASAEAPAPPRPRCWFCSTTARRAARPATSSLSTR
jgi:uncharacterized protein (DUF433 family)